MSLRKILFAPVPVPVRLLTMVVGALLVIAALLAFAGGGLPPPSFKVSRSQEGIMPLNYPAWRTASDWLTARKYVVLTFDDGPYGGGVDERILSILQRHHAPAIFFIVCNRLDSRTDHVLSEIVQAGHLIGNHSYDHPRLPQLNLADLQHQVEGCSERIANVTGRRPRYFRPPFGQTSLGVGQVVQSAGMGQVLWNANSQDSWLTKPNQILYWSMEQTGNGSILLMHSKPTTAAALDRVLTELEGRGFRFVLPAT